MLIFIGENIVKLTVRKTPNSIKLLLNKVIAIVSLKYDILPLIPDKALTIDNLNTKYNKKYQ